MRKKLFIFIVVLGCLGGGTYLGIQGVRLLEMNERVKALLVDAARPYLGPDFDVEAMDVGWQALSIRDIRFSPEGRNFTLVIDEVRVDFSLRSLISYRFQPYRAAESVTLVRPRLYLNAPDATMAEHGTVSPSAAFYEVLDAYAEIHDQLDFIKRILLVGAEVHWTEPNGVTTVLVHDLDGWVDKRAKQAVRLAFDGRFLETDSRNVTIAGHLDFASDTYELDLDLRRYDLAQRMPLYSPTAFRFTAGTLDGRLHLQAGGALRRQDAVNCSGSITLADVGLTMADNQFQVDHITMHADLLDNNLTFTDCYQDFHGARLVYTGHINNIFQPELNLQVQSQDLSLSALQQDFFPQFRPRLEGTLDLTAEVIGPVADPQLTGTVSAPYVTIDGTEWRDIRSTVALTTSGVTVRDFYVASDYLLCRGEVDYTFGEDATLSLVVEAEEDLAWMTRQLPGVRDVPKKAHLRLGLFGNQENLTGRFVLEVTGGRYEASVAGNLTLIDDELSFQGASPTGRFAVAGLVDKFGRYARIDNVSNPFELLNAIAETPYFRALDRDFTTQFAWSIVEGDYQWEGSGTRKERYDRGEPTGFTLSGSSSGTADSRQFTSTMVWTPNQASPFTLSLAMMREGERWQIRQLEVPRVFSATGVYVDGDAPTLAGTIRVNTEITDLATLLGTPFWEIESGNISGEIQVSGPINHPSVQAALYLADGVIGQVDEYRGTLEIASADGHDFQITNLELRHKGTPVFFGSGTLNPYRDKVYGQFHARKIDSGLLFATLGQDSPFLTGQVSMDLDVRGTLSHPFFMGSLDIRNGVLTQIPFERLHLTFGGSPIARDAMDMAVAPAPDPEQSLPQGVWIHEFDLKQNDKLWFTGSGYVPLNSDEDLALTIHGEGDLLHVLTEMDAFYRTATGQGSVDLAVGGTLENPLMISGRLRIVDGTLRLRDAVRKLDHFYVDMELVAGERFIRWRQFEGIVEGERFAISNQPSVTVLNDAMEPVALEPMVFLEDGLHWGILSLHTGPGGLTGHIPKLMPENELVTLHLSGLRAEEDFYLAGPLAQPVLRGTITVEEMEFTYPFLEYGDPDSPPSLANRVLAMMNIDLRILYLENNRFQATVEHEASAIAEEVEVNIVIDRDTDLGLRARGVLDDSTFGMEGTLTSTRGKIEYLDLIFRPERVMARFHPDKLEAGPSLSGRARTTLRDSSNIPQEVFLEVYNRDPETGRTTYEGEWEFVNFRLSSNLPSRELASRTKSSQRELMEMLGYGHDNIGTRGTEMVAARADRMWVRPLLRPFERGVRGFLGLDEFRIRPNITRSFAHGFAESTFSSSSGVGLSRVKAFNTIDLLQNSSILIGKHFLRDFYLSYFGRVVPGYQEHGIRDGLGFNHLLGLEYRIASGLLMEVQYDYQRDRILYGREDTRVWFRHYLDLW